MNRLQYESSPYLLQHKNNPVDWYPWSDEAFRRAVQEDKPVFLSIGYSACHWCHVMEKESFENDETARFMNKNFISIKVDREERPDIDNIYMNFVQITTGSGGWPLNVFLLPDKTPFWGGTYFPPEEKYGRPGFPQILKTISDIYNNRKEDIIKQQADILKALKDLTVSKRNPNNFALPDFNKAFASILRRYDEDWGGFGSAPKFPSALTLMFILRYYYQTGNKISLEIVENTLRKMAGGGIYDQLGGGFHRYSTDEQWLIPHFEKMLYDNALLSRTYLETYRITNDKFYLRIAEEILEYITREMTDESGGFFSAQDADSQGVEGKYFIWDYDELRQVLSNDELNAASKIYGISKNGNFEGANILTRRQPLDKLGQLLSISGEEIENTEKQLRAKLLSIRDKRNKPGLDDKLLTSWNALMLQSFIMAFGVTGSEKYLTIALKNADFLWDKCFMDDILFHSCKNGELKYEGYLDNYSYTAEAFISLYEVTFDEKWLERGDKLTQLMIKKFYDPEDFDFYFSAIDAKDLIIRAKDIFDSVVPSGNSSAVHVLLKMAIYMSNPEYYEIAKNDYSHLHDQIIQYPENFPYIFSAVYMDYTKIKEVAVVFAGLKDKRDFIFRYFNDFFPFTLLSAKLSGHPTKLALLEDKTAIRNSTTYYICRNYTCRAPVFTFEEMKEEIKKANILE